MTNSTTGDRASDTTHTKAAGRRSPGGWRFGDRARCALALIAVPVLAGLVLRAVLYASFHEGAMAWSSLALFLGRGLGLGLVRDALVASIALAPLLLALAVLRLSWLARPRVRLALFASVSTLVVFEGLVEFFFFEEFNARFNNIAVDYVLFPGEVAGNLWQSYSIPLHVAVSVAAGCALALLAGRFLAGVRFEPLSLRARARGAATVLGTSALSVAGLWCLPRGAGADRVSDEIAASGLVELVHAFWSADLEFPLYYRTLPEPEAHARAARFLGFPPVTADGEFQLQKSVTSGSASRAPRQIVVVLEESLGSDFVGALPGAKAACTPELERHFADGLLLSNLIANGNRTVRGLEGVLCSFVPLPGYAILSRGKSENVATVARVLRAVGYDTVFLYGGRGTFDHMESFLGGNGWDELVTEPDYPEDAFRTAWGVADEYVFDALLARQEKARALGEPLFATMLSVSNHKPYDFPRDRYALEPGLHGRPGAVRYADACIGGYLDALHERGLDADTLVLIVGDHGARVYGAEEIPTQSYRIPALFVTPDARWQGQRIERLCSQVDLVPTLLDLAGIEYRAPFLGTSVLGQPADGGRAFVQHNRDVGILSDDALVVLGLQKTLVTYARSGRESHAFTLVPEKERTPELRELAADASAVFQSVYELYETRSFRLPEAGVAGAVSPGLAHLTR